MKFIKWKTILITCIVCLLPISFGVMLWDKLPDAMAIHFNLYNEPDGFAPKTFAVIGLPVMMAVLQAICCITQDMNTKKHGECTMVERTVKWIIPAMSVILYGITVGIGVGADIDVRRVAAVLLGMIFLIAGSVLPKFDYIKNYTIEPEKARKINRFMGGGMVVMGALMLVTAFLPPVATFLWLALLLPYAAINAVYAMLVVRGK